MASENTSTTPDEGATSAPDAHNQQGEGHEGTAHEGMAHETGDLHTSTGTAADHGGGHAGVFPPFDSSTFASQIVWLAITFGLFYYMMSKMVLPRIAQTLEQRHDRIASDLAEAEKLKTETDEAIAAYEQSLAEARQRAGEIARSTRDRVQETIDAERAAAEASLAKKFEEAEAHINAVKTKAMGEVDAIAAETAAELVEALGGGKPTRRP